MLPDIQYGQACMFMDEALNTLKHGDNVPYVVLGIHIADSTQSMIVLPEKVNHDKARNVLVAALVEIDKAIFEAEQKARLEAKRNGQANGKIR